MSEQKSDLATIVSLDRLFGMMVHTREDQCWCGACNAVLREVHCGHAIRIEVRCYECDVLRFHLSRDRAFRLIRELRAERSHMRRCQPVDAA